MKPKSQDKRQQAQRSNAPSTSVEKPAAAVQTKKKEGSTRARKYIDWKSPYNNRFIQCWQAIFNKRIASCGPFALQVGDVFIFLVPLVFVVFCFIALTDQSSSGVGAELIIGITVIFGCRNGVLSLVFNLSLERALLWHQYLAWLSLAAGINHWINSESSGSGFITLGVIAAFIVFSLKPIRRYLWEVFMKLHWILILILLAASIIHGVIIGVIGIAYYFLDICYRFYQAHKFRNLKREVIAEQIGKDIVKLSFAKDGVEYRGGQYFFIMVPKLSYFQWHPFSVSSGPDDKIIEFYVKVLGSWTEELFEGAGYPGKPIYIHAYLDGPYGSSSISIDSQKYQNFICLSGGIGVTPMLSVTKELISELKEGRPVRKKIFIWTGKQQNLIDAILKPNELYSRMHPDDQNVLMTFCHLSRGKVQSTKQTDVEQQQLNPDNENIKILSGRPPLDRYFEIAHAKAVKSGQGRVGVLVCGPQSLINSAETLASEFSTDGVIFDVHQEVFLF